MPDSILDPNWKRIRPPSKTLSCGPGRARPEFQDECDVNQILRKFQKTGLVSHLAKGQPQYGDFTNVTSYADAVSQVREAEAAFLELPANIRRRFENNPTALVEFMNDAANLDEAIELGLVTKRAKPAETATETPASGPQPPADENVAPAGAGTTGDS